MAVTVTELGTANSATSTAVITLSSTAGVGDLVIVGLVNNSAGPLSANSITDSGANTWVQTSSAGIFNTSAARASLYVSRLTTALASGSTITLTTTAVAKTLQALLVTGSPYRENPIIQQANTNNNQAAVTTIATNTLSVVTDSDALIVAIHAYLSNPTYSPPATYSQPTTTQVLNSTTLGHSMVYKEITLKASQTASATIGTANNACGCIIGIPIKAGMNLNNYQQFMVGDGMSVSEKIR